MNDANQIDQQASLDKIKEIIKLQNKYWAHYIEVKKSEISGNGVFAACDMPAGELFEFAPALIYHFDTHEVLADYFGPHVFFDYAFTWCEDEKLAAIVFGYGSIYNHSDDPNISWSIIKGDGELEGAAFYTTKPVKAGEELVSTYNNAGVYAFTPSGTRIKMID